MVSRAKICSMEWLYTLFIGNGIAHAVLTFALTITLGILLGRIRIGEAYRSASRGFCSSESR